MHNVHDVFFVHKALARATISGRHWSIIFKNVYRVRAFSMCLKKWAGLEVGWWWWTSLNNYVPEWKTVLNNICARVDDCLK